MADSKKLIERNLPFSGRYVYLGITRGNIMDGQFCTCDNCGKLITNMVTVKDRESLKSYTIGTDCAETLAKAKCLYNNGTQTDYWLDIYSYNQVARFVTELNAGATLEKSDFYCTLINRKGKTMQVFTSQLREFFPKYL